MYANGSPIPPANGGFLYGTQLVFQDLTSGWTAALNGNSEFDCIGIFIDRLERHQGRLPLR